jgi:hypothetical protein
MRPSNPSKPKRPHEPAPLGVVAVSVPPANGVEVGLANGLGDWDAFEKPDTIGLTVAAAPGLALAPIGLVLDPATGGIVAAAWASAVRGAAAAATLRVAPSAAHASNAGEVFIIMPLFPARVGTHRYALA